MSRQERRPEERRRSSPDAGGRSQRTRRRMALSLLTVCLAISLFILGRRIAWDRPTSDMFPTGTSAGEGVDPHSLPEVDLHTFDVQVLDTAPLLTIGLEEGPEAYLFGNILAGAFMPDGRIVVADDQYNEIRIYSGEGVHEKTLGGTGGGPGEFRRLSRLAVLGDGAIAAWDYDEASVALFTSSGRFEREWRVNSCITEVRDISRLPEGAPLRRTGGIRLSSLCREPIGFLTRNDLLVGRGAYPPPADPALGEVLIVDSLTYYMLTATADSLGVIESIPAADWIEIGVPPEDYGKLGAIRLFDGWPYVAVRAPWVVYGNSEDVAIRAFRGDTYEERVVTVPLKPAPVDDAAVDSVRVLHRLRERMLPEDAWNKYFSTFLLASGPFPEYQPFYSDLMLDADHRIWIGDYLGSWAWDVVRRSSGHTWTVLTLDGHVAARVHLPGWLYQQRPAPLLDIKGDRVLLRMVDSDSGIQRVGIFRLVAQ